MLLVVSAGISPITPLPSLSKATKALAASINNLRESTVTA
jgi:hypothetical protein